MTEESTLSEDGLAKRIADFAASFAANQKALADLAQIGNPNMVAMLAEAALSDRGDGFACYVAENMVAIRASALRSEEVCTVLVMGYELGISVGSAGRASSSGLCTGRKALRTSNGPWLLPVDYQFGLYLRIWSHR